LDLDFQKNRFLVPPLGCVDASVLSFPANKAMVVSVDFFTPIVNNPFWFGQIAAANSLSDIYAMGGEPYVVLNIVCFPIKEMDKNILKEILKGGLAKVKEAGAVMGGGHSVEDSEIKYGLSVTGIVDPKKIASNDKLRVGDFLVLTKPLGTGILATALKGEVGEQAHLEALLYQWCAKLNNLGGKAIAEFGLRAATDVTGFGLGGHLLEMARSSHVQIEVWSSQVPILEEARELAGMGLIPAGSYANKHYCAKLVEVKTQDTIGVDIIFDAQTSGGLVLGVPSDLLDRVITFLESRGELAKVIGKVTGPSNSGKLIIT